MSASRASRQAADFTLVLAGGGARGYAHVGVLRALEAEELSPSAIVGVSMGALVGTAFSLREDWIEAVMSIDTSRFPRPRDAAGGHGEGHGRLRTALGRVHAAWSMLTGWGAPDEAVEAGKAMLDTLFGDRDLGRGRIPVVVCATDLLAGSRVEIHSGLAREAVYASCALAGILPPAEIDGRVLVDGVYADVAPIDVGRGMKPDVVIAVDPGQPMVASEIKNGAQAVLRAMEICHRKHAEMRIGDADLVIRPEFGRYIDTLDFDARRACVAAGLKAARKGMPGIKRLLEARKDTSAT
ncbi:MAG: hypothetical protein AMXMBFR53_14670 [Gemmatimonadota bacterium]